MKTDPQIDAYIAKSAEFARPILRHLRELVHQSCPVVEETVKWRMPSFTHHGILCGMAAFKAHCRFWFWHRGMRAVIEEDLGQTGNAMDQFGCITRVGDLPSDKAMLCLIKRAAQLNASGAPARTARKKPAAPRVPDFLAAALKKNKTAAAGFARLTPARRREYSEWLAGAKRAETRAKRLATALAWIAEGKPLNWKYQRS